MRLKMLSIGLTAALAIFYVTVFVTSASAATEKVLHSFNTTGSNGEVPYSSLIFDTAGNLYGGCPIFGVLCQRWDSTTLNLLRVLTRLHPFSTPALFT